MAEGKDPKTADRLGGHKVTTPRQPVRTPGDEREPRPEGQGEFSASEPEPAAQEPVSGADGVQP
jgi:hypothetical protein